MKYYAEIESEFFLPVNNIKKINHTLDNSKLPKTFYDKYKIINDLIPKIKKLFAKFSFNTFFNNPNYDDYNKKYFAHLLKIYQKKSQLISSRLHEKLTLLESKESIQCWANICDFIHMVDNTLIDKDTFISIMQLLNEALIDIGKIDGSLSKHYLPDKWLLTSKGFLYNMQTTAHETGSFKNYYLEKTNWFLTKTQPLPHKNNTIIEKINPCPELNDPSIILKNGYISCNVIDELLHFIDYYHFNKKVYDPKIIMSSIGMIELCKDLMFFFDKLELYTDYPKDNLRKSISITNGNYLDFLIRCCGVSKIASFPYKTIITSSLTAKKDFEEYLEKDFNVCFVPPIIINREKRMVEELNMDSPIVSEYIKHKVICEDDLDKGKIYTNYLKF